MHETPRMQKELGSSMIMAASQLQEPVASYITSDEFHSPEKLSFFVAGYHSVLMMFIGT